MAGRAVFLEHPSSLAHDTGPHPEQAARITAIERQLEAEGGLGFERIESPAVERSVLTAVHPAAYVAWIEEAASRGGGALDLDTVMSSGSFDAALHACGGAVRLVEMLGAAEARCGFSAHRPPGHHALPSRPMGFCLFNNVAVAARFAINSLGLSRVMILDWDVHHGNGTNDIFWESREVLFVSIHQAPLYPGTGAASDVGGGPGAGFTVNLPVPPGSGDATFSSLVDHVAVPLARAFEPQVVLISAGYDAHRDDPLAGCSVTEAGYRAMASSMVAACDSLDAPVGCVLEGGYELGALGRSVAATMEALADGADAGRGLAEDSAMAAAARERLREWWPGL
jgi:acetoin utilization deacetylase AcuC-like enzyme